MSSTSSKNFKFTSNSNSTYTASTYYYTDHFISKQKKQIKLYPLSFSPHYIHAQTFQVETDLSTMDIHQTRSRLEAIQDFTSLKADDLKLRIEEMLRIKQSVSNELRDLEAKRRRLHTDVGGLTQQIDDLKQEFLHQQMELDRLKISVVQAQAAHREAVERNTPELAPPKRILSDSVPEILPEHTASGSCRMFNCFDHSRCALTSGFPVYLYDPDEFLIVNKGWDIDGFLKTYIKHTLGEILFCSRLLCKFIFCCIILLLYFNTLANELNEHPY